MKNLDALSRSRTCSNFYRPLSHKLYLCIKSRQSRKIMTFKCDCLSVIFSHHEFRENLRGVWRVVLNQMS